MEQLEVLQEILKWQKLQGIKILHELVPILLDDDEKKKIYEMTDGTKTIKDIQKHIKVSSGKVSMLWNSWYTNGILDKDGNKYKKIISLKELGY